MTTGRAYLDHASASPLRPEAFAAMLPFLRDHHADPGRLHAEGRVTRVALEQAREAVAAMVGARPREVVFTSGGTEAVAAAVFGALTRRPGSAVLSAVEHSAVRESAARWATGVTVVDVDRTGRFEPDAVAEACSPETSLVCLHLANHEVGTVQPAARAIELVRARAPEVLVHLDGRAALGHLAIDFAALGADLVSLSAHGFGGPKGAGALLVRRGLRIPPLLLGGAQERARRAGLENVPAFVGFGAVAAAVDVAQEAQQARALLEPVLQLLGRIPGAERFGATDPADTLAHLVCFGIAGVEAEPVLLGLDQSGVAVHSGSACASEMLEPSPVLSAMGVDAAHSLRVSVGWNSTEHEVGMFVAALPVIVERLRALRT